MGGDTERRAARGAGWAVMVLAAVAALLSGGAPDLAAQTADSLALQELEALKSHMDAVLAAQQDSMNHMWTMTAAALVFLMQAGFLLLEAGMVRSKNSINVAQKNIADFVIATAGFYLLGFGVMFGPSVIGGGWLGWNGLGFGSLDDWHYTFFVFQVVFCGTAATIVSGAVAERMRFSAYLAATCFISVVIYPVIGHWAWGNLLIGDNPAILADLGFIDFAGSTVVHSVGGWVALAGVIVIGPRIGRFDENGKPLPIHGHSAALATAGAILLWVGWIGFNGGSTTTGDPAFAHIISNTILAGAFGSIASMLIGRWVDGLFRPDRAINGVLAGLVGITAGCDAVSTYGALTIGLSSGIVVVIAAHAMENWLRLDDCIGAVPVHGVCGAWGTLMAGALATPDALVAEDRLTQVMIQALGIGMAFVWAFGAALVFFLLLKWTIGIRVSTEHELQGLNEAEHGTTLGTGLLQKAMLELATGNGDLSHRLDETTGDESGELAGSFNLLMERLQGMVLNVAGNARNLLQSSLALRGISDTMSHDSGEMTKRAGHVSQLTNDVSQRVSHMSQGVGSLNENVLDIANAAQTMSGHVVGAHNDVDRIAQAITTIAETARAAAHTAASAAERAHDASTTVDSLSGAVGEITSVVDAIRAIAAQTRMLALNAAIEAERAGSAGEGFRVVANEVRILADQATGAADDIGRRIDAVSGGTSSAVSVIEDIGRVITEVHGAVDRIDESVAVQQESISAISGGMSRAADEAKTISGAIDHVSKTAREVSFDARHAAQETHSVFHIIGQVNEAALESSATAHRVQEAASAVFRIAGELESMVGKLGGAKAALDKAGAQASAIATREAEEAY
ncbi:ammonium transporter [Roseospirillum parvum]|uniref:Ammonium transporter, Amt family n=1 Tax=Roseospirillum parvum TaxID=83401 RepID=A0A1G8BPC9_9PROT|nr:ammonium transporter [Roseospirillum parvum]SDH34924.1 ammonium transporter, Amt family [Roseospirillum parvum]